VGNPYPSAIDFNQVSKAGLQNAYYLWDPQLGTYGGYQTFTGGPVYSATPGGGSYNNGNYVIESGQAFFVRATGGGGSISFTENCKVAGSNLVTRGFGPGKRLRTSLYSLPNNTTHLIDGTLIEFDETFSNDVDDMDALKMNNFGENIGIRKNGRNLSVEFRSDLVPTDTLFYALGQLSRQTYQLTLVTEGLEQPGIVAFFEDLYLQTSTALNLNGTTNIAFTIDANATSSRFDRFRIVFKQLVPVPVTFTNITAVWENKDARVTWQVENEINIDHYELEKSADGRLFNKIATVTATGSSTYSNLDRQAFVGDNFYRVRSVGQNGEASYSEIVQLSSGKEMESITVYPNPVKSGVVGLMMYNQPAGDYLVKLYGINGQLLYTQRFFHPGGTGKKDIRVGAVIARGLYRLEISRPGNTRVLLKLLFD